ncbi:MAG: ATP-binding protein [Blautia sp.]|nr:ATP-binding protein [Blautia sp.]
MNHQSCEQLTQMNLSAMRREYQRQEELPATIDLGFDERFSMIVQAQFDKRRDNRIRRALKEAVLREPSATLSELEFSEKRNLSKHQIAQLSSMSWIKEGKGILITGATGTGKTFILCAFAHDACVMGYTARYYRMTRLIEYMAAARDTGEYDKKLAELGKPDILVLDDFGMKQCDHLFSLDLLEVVEERYHKRKSVLIGAQMPVRLWPEFFKNKTAADGFMDRIVNNAYRIELKGPSRRPKMPDDEMWESCRTDVTETNEPSADGQNDISGITGKEEQDEAQPG